MGEGANGRSRLGRASLSSPAFARLSPERRQRVLCRHANSLRVGAKVETERKGEKKSKKERGQAGGKQEHVAASAIAVENFINFLLQFGN